MGVLVLGILLASFGWDRIRARLRSDWFESKHLTLSPVVKGLKEPSLVTGTPDNTGRLLIVEREGRIRVAHGGVLRTQPFLDLVDEVSTAGEEGLLGLAFDPRFAANGRVFIAYTVNSRDLEVVRYQVSHDDPDQLDPHSAHPILTIPKRAQFHNSGMLAFGPDGYLYVGVGDDQRGIIVQDLGNLYGKILRLDVDGGDPYTIPRTNPFVDQPGARPEIWAYGLRNPWRFSFDHVTGDLWIADVHHIDEGSESREAVIFQPANSRGGENYGFPMMQAFHCDKLSTCHPDGVTLPIIEYPHQMNCAVIGGHVYRGRSAHQLTGVYLFGDFCTGGVFAARRQSRGGWTRVELGFQPIRISSFGEDASGEVYVADLQGGVIYRVADGSLP